MKKVFTVYDSKAEAFLQPFFSDTSGLAIRSFDEACNNPEHQFAIHAGDYTLFEIATFDERSGKFDTLSVPINLGLALTHIQKTPEHGAVDGAAIPHAQFSNKQSDIEYLNQTKPLNGEGKGS